MRLSAWMLLFGFGCSDPTAVRLIIDADPSIQEETVRFRVTAIRQDGSSEMVEASPPIEPNARYPFELPVIPRNGDATRRFQLVAEAFDAAGVRIGFQRIESSFEDGQTKYVRVMFESGCQDVSCPERQRCIAGLCESACVRGANNETDEPLPVACGAPLPRPPPDGCDYGTALGAQNGEARRTWPACPTFDAPDSEECLHQDGGDIRIVDGFGSLGPRQPPPCGGEAVFRADTRAAPGNQAHLALPVAGPQTQLFSRVFAFFPSDSVERLEMQATNQSVLALGLDHSLGGSSDLVNLRWGGEEFFLQYVIDDVQTTHPIPAPVIRDTWM
ncbi:MAG: hypothetical protein AAGF12_41155, partial [Myxococcota bacterium]